MLQDNTLKKEMDKESGSKQMSHEVLLVKTPPASYPMDAMSKNASVSAITTSKQEEVQKEEGNAQYKRGHYVAAIRSYTHCLDYNPNNAVVLSNRAMAYLKNQEFAKAEDDCTLALEVDPAHVKSYSRRGTARNSMGKHRLALLDFHRAAMLDPRSRQIQTQLQWTRELIRTAIKCSPKRIEFDIDVLGQKSQSCHTSERDKNASENETSLRSPKVKQCLCEMEQKSASRQESASQLRQDAASLRKTGTTKVLKTLTACLQLPKKAPATSYEFCRVWKMLALRGETEQKSRLLKLRADYLLMIDPLTLCSIFKTAIECDVLCEIFYIFRYAVLHLSETNSSLPTSTLSFVFAFINELTKVPRFDMTVMLLSDREKEDVTWVVQYLEAQIKKKSNVIEAHDVANLKKLYQLL